jgi:hypothetical protein
VNRESRGRDFYVACTTRSVGDQHVSSRDTIVTPSVSNAAHDVRFLRATFKRALRSNTRAWRSVFLDIFSGAGGLSALLRKTNSGALGVDIRFGLECDVTNPRVLAIVEGWISRGCASGLWLGTRGTGLGGVRPAPRGAALSPPLSLGGRPTSSPLAAPEFN